MDSYLKVRRIVSRLYTGILPIGIARRYNNLYTIIQKNKCRRLMEIGTWDGNHAIKMINAAGLNFPPEMIEYYGFDLFETSNDATLEKEFSKGRPSSSSFVKSKLNITGAKISLFKGDTQEVLPKIIKELPMMDFVFIDGGHSIETVNNDWHHVQELMDKNTIVIFDDYYNINHVGCKKVIDGLDRKKFAVEILPPKDKFKKDWGFLEINFVKVLRL